MSTTNEIIEYLQSLDYKLRKDQILRKFNVTNDQFKELFDKLKKLNLIAADVKQTHNVKKIIPGSKGLGLRERVAKLSSSDGVALDPFSGEVFIKSPFYLNDNIGSVMPDDDPTNTLISSEPVSIDESISYSYDTESYLYDSKTMDFFRKKVKDSWEKAAWRYSTTSDTVINNEE